MKKLATLFFFLILAFSGRAQWVAQSSANFSWGTPLFKVKVVNANTVWAATPYQRLAKTTDGGISWSAYPINDPNFLNLNIASISAADANTAWAGTTMNSVHPSNLPASRIYRTTDGGLTWLYQSSAFPNVGTRVHFLHFFDINNGVAIGTTQTGRAAPGPDTLHIITTSNGGITWQPVPAANIPGLPGTFTTAATFGNTIWFMDTNRQLYKSTNKGLNWTTSDPGFPAANSQLMTLAFCNNQNGLAYFSGEFRKSTDGGTSWVAVNPTGYWFNEKIVGIPGTNSFIAISSVLLASGSAITHDHGSTWQPIEYILRHFDADFLNSTTGYSGGLGQMYKLNGNILSANENQALVSTFSIAPNPSSGIFKISGNQVQAFTIEVYNLVGIKILSKQCAPFVLAEIDLSNQAKGIYMVKIISKGPAKTMRIVLN